ncbi:MAG: signal peptidase I [Melioribacteraceae bacterium]|nr:signal peptidase I [Melioribacteraceae bacterium]
MKKKTSKTKETIKEYTSLIFFAFILTSSIIQGSRIPTGSMMNTILIGDQIMVNKLAYNLTTPRNIPYTDIRLPHYTFNLFGDPERNDIVVFEFPGEQNELYDTEFDSYVKRCVGEPGDKVEIIDRVLFVNDKEFPIPAKIRYAKMGTEKRGISDQRIFPKNAGWNGDNYGPIIIPKKGEIVNLTTENIEQYRKIINLEYGKEVVTVSGNRILVNGKETDTYKVKKDQYFMIGDNRDNSWDSRYWGFVSRDNIVGQPLFVYFSWDSDIPFSQFGKLLGSIRWNRIGKIL